VTDLSAGIRIALFRAFRDRGQAEDRALREAGLGRTATDDTPLGIALTWTGARGAVVIEQWATNEALACASFTGTNHVDLAARLVPTLRYVPASVLHRAARTAPTGIERSDALRVLGQVHSAADGLSRWDARIQRTLDLAWRDPDPSVRIDAAAVELECHPSRARRNIETAMAQDPDEAVRAALRAYHLIDGDGDVPDADSGPDDVDEGPVAVPFWWTGSADDLIARFSNTTTTARRDTDWDGDVVATVVELAPRGFDATIALAVTDGGVGCVAFTGPQQTATAIGSAAALRYIPVELATATATRAEDAALRVTALRALTMASSRRLFPGPPMDPAVARAITAAAGDADPAVRWAATSAAVLLRDELAAVPDLDDEGGDG
jgi:hypothetical protein